MSPEVKCKHAMFSYPIFQDKVENVLATLEDDEHLYLHLEKRS